MLYVVRRFSLSYHAALVLFVSILACVFFFFFFQAEDGIRDHCVTGVQTCALPISSIINSWARSTWSGMDSPRSWMAARSRLRAAFWPSNRHAEAQRLAW